MTVEELLADFPPWVADIVERLRSVVTRSLPEAAERVYPGWRAIGYRHPVAGYVCGIFPRDDHARLLFEHGRELADPQGLLTGSTRQVRWVEIGDVDDLTPDLERELGALLTAAVDLRR